MAESTKSVPSSLGALGLALALAWLVAPQRGSLDRELHTAIVAQGGRRVSRSPPTWQHDHFLSPAELVHVEHAIAAMPEDELPACALPDDSPRRCGILPVGNDTVLLGVVDRLGALFGANATLLASGIPVVRLRSGSPGIGTHLDHFHGGPMPAATALVYVSAMPEGSGETYFPATGLKVAAVPGRLLAWTNVAGDHPNQRATHGIRPIPSSAPHRDILLIPMDRAGDEDAMATGRLHAINHHVGFIFPLEPGIVFITGESPPSSECDGCNPCLGRRLRAVRGLLFGTVVAYGCEACCDGEDPP